uniref:Tripartite motif containing 39 n=1 Tax=Sinocyclocheilus grahami TaxID=75366 RepID=A0A672QJI2_SINGR
MASSSVVSEKSLTCSICLDVFTDPVTTSCGHNFCMVCIRKGIKRKRIQEKAEVSCDSCPEKKMQTPHKTAEKLMKHKLINPVKNLDEYICKNHERPLDLYCKDDQTAICQFCIESDHRNHNTVLLETESLVIISNILKSLIYNAVLLELTEEKHKETERRGKELIRELDEEIVELKRRQTELEQLSHPMDFTQVCLSHQTMVRNNATCTLGLRAFSPLLLHELLYHFSVDVTLDPDTAHPELMLSDDGKKVWNTVKSQKIPDTPKRFNYCSCVLGKEGFSSQKFYYEVQVSGMEWDLGVAKESIDRKGDIGLNPENGYWTIWLRNRDEYAANVRTPVPLTLKEKPVKVGVFVDFEGGLISFYDVEARYHIYFFTGQSFPENLYPYFSPGECKKGQNSHPLIITPVDSVE